MINEEIKNSRITEEIRNNAQGLFKQYTDIKAENPGVVLLFRLGDFYEGFFEDALIFSKELGLTLTHKDGGLLGKVPMAGIPVKSVNTFIPKLLNRNYKIAICEQIGTPEKDKKNNTKIIERKIVKTITPGTITEINLLESGLNNYLAAVINVKDTYGLAYTDITTGEFKVTTGKLEGILAELARIKPSEVLGAVEPMEIKPFQIVPDEKICLPDSITSNYTCSKVPISYFEEKKSIKNIKSVFNVISLEPFGLKEHKEAFLAAGAIIEYLFDTQQNVLPKFDIIKPYSLSEYVSIDANTRRNLELTETARDRQKHGSLYWAVDNVHTSIGARMLKSWITQPVLSIEEITKRQDSVEELIHNPAGRIKLINLLEKTSDIERLAVKISSGSVNPADFIALRNTFSNIPDFINLFKTFQTEYLNNFPQQIYELVDYMSIIERTIEEEAPNNTKEPGFIKDNVNGNLDYYRELITKGDKWLKDFEEREKNNTGIKNLKVGYTRNFGYYIEVTKSNISQVPMSYVRRQTLTNVERYITQELKQHEDEVLSAQLKVLDLEQKLFKDFVEYSKSLVDCMRETSHFIARVDVLTSFAVSAIESNYIRPEITDSKEICIKDGRHPVVEKILPMGSYVSNDLRLIANAQDNNDTQFMILTGPNMAGKSTYMRQNALIVLLAQIGSFVPASYARIGIVDKIFTRSGAADDLSMGQSTFMVEMTETAFILNSATEKSLILLDEIGRGTSTYDGVAIAWSVAEYIASKIKARTIFATHYHELNVMSKTIEQIKNYRITLNEENGEIQFLRKVIEGSASKSYGIHVAKMAGLPESVLSKAENIMNRMQRDYSKDLSSKKTKNSNPDIPQLTLSFDSKEEV
ncbi:MAG: DNA mismatch repair protein MutS [Candidatus Gastranaerophilales bacterium]|nr:DNA mismatch repair protein MutS [Candidatus Gastranaerophilales bacterium]